MLRFYNKKVFFCGIGGISMSGLAKLLQDENIFVGGSDENPSDVLYELKDRGMEIFFEQRKENVKDYDVFVYSLAIPFNNEEFKEARNKGLMLLERADLLKIVAEQHNNIISVSGCHGKSSTSAMLGKIFIDANKETTVHIGANTDFFDGNVINNGKKFFITEACEFKRSFLKLKSDIGIITNIESDHMDCYANLEEIKKAYLQFAKNSKLVLINGDNKNSEYLKKEKPELFSVGLNKDCDFYAENITYDNGLTSFDFYALKKKITRFFLKMKGEFNVLNSLFAIATALLFNIDENTIKESLKNYNGIKRRFEKIENTMGINIISDYAHHPTEIKETINLAKACGYKRVYVIFEPHTYSRTKGLLNEFKTCFKKADELYILDTYPAREKYDSDGDADTLFEAVVNKNKTRLSSFSEGMKKITAKIKQTEGAERKSLLLVLGAGSIDDFLRKFVNDKS